MRRLFLYISVLSVFFGLILVGFGSWLLQSTPGTLWLLEAVAHVADVQITTGQLEGRLADDLVVDELTVTWPDGELTARRIHLDWDPFSVLQQKLKIRALDVEQMLIKSVDNVGSSVVTSVDENGAPFSAHDLAFLPDWLTIEISRLQVHEFAYQSEAEAVVIAEELSGSYLWSRQQLNASEFKYISPFVQLQGEFSWDLQRPHLEMTADVHLPDTLVDPQLFQDIVVPVAFPGKLSLDGDWNDFNGPVSFGTAAEVDNAVWLAADAQGSWRGIRFDNLQGRYLNGRLVGKLDLDWIDSYRMHGKLTGAELDLGVLIDDLDGRTHLDVTGELLVPYDQRPLQASLAGTIHESQLRGHPVAGDLAADWQDGALNELHLDLYSEEARVVAHGKPAERLNLDITVPNLQPFHPDLAGKLLASGWLSWSDNYLTGEIDGSAEDIVWQETSLSHLSFMGSHLVPQAPLEFQLDGQGLRYADLQLDQLHVGINGVLKNHNLQVEAHSLDGAFDLQLAGQYQDDLWQAQLESFSGEMPTLGSWELEGAANLVWQPEGFSLADFSLLSRHGERVTLNVSQLMGPEVERVALTWRDLNHDRLASLLPSQPISGKSSGELSLIMNGQQPVSLEVRVKASAERHDSYVDISIPALTAEVIWQKDGLNMEIQAVSRAGEHFGLLASSSQPPNWQWPPDELSLNMRWQDVTLERLSRFSDDLEVTGNSHGDLQLEIAERQLLRASASISADGVMQRDGQRVGFSSLLTDLKWDDEGFTSSTLIKGAHDGLLKMHLTSTVPPDLTWPDSGQIDMNISNFDLQSLNPLLPSEFALDGLVHGQSGGYWQNGSQIFLHGNAELAEGDLLLRNSGGQVDLKVKQADLDWQWQGESFNGSLALLLAEEGTVRGRWQLPLPARWPFEMVENGDLEASLQGQFHASGMLALISPGTIQDLDGLIESDLQVVGTWQAPTFSGQLALTEAGAYLPATGVTIEDLELRATLQGTQLTIEDFSLRSGPGIMTGSGGLDFDRWRLQRFDLAFKGDRLQIYNFPEIRVLGSPDLTLSGNLEKIQLNGSLLIPEMSLLGTTSVPETMPSSDVVISGADQNGSKVVSINADVLVAVELGDQVWIKTAGIETKLKGGGMVTLNEQGHLATWGEFSLSEGTYKAYGANLNIKQGLLNYTGGPITNPSVRVFAARDVGSVQAGVQITGTVEEPVVSLYSRPSMPERDILGYIFMGRPMRVGQEGEDALLIGAGALMPRYGETFSDLGISEIDIQGLFAGTGGVSLRKRLTEKWELQSTLGIESGVDLYYNFEFD